MPKRPYKRFYYLLFVNNHLRTRSLSALAAAVHVAEQGTFAGASREMGLSTSAISKAIARLEQELGVKLFHRTTRSVSLTPEGERYVQGAKPLLVEMDALTAEITDSLAEPRGLLRISAPVAYARTVLAPGIAAFCRRFSDVRVDLFLDDRDVDLAAGKVDVAIRTGVLPDNATLVARRLFDDPLVCCAAPAYLARSGEPISPPDLEQHDCLSFRNSRTGRAVSWVFAGGNRRSPSGAITVNDIEAVSRVALSGAGIAQLPAYLANPYLETGRLQEILRGFRPAAVPFSALYLDRRFVSPRIRAFIDFLLTITPR